jgi:hypothetical protein
MQAPVRIGADLTVRLGCAAATLSPSQGFRLAEQLIRKSTRRMMIAEAFAEPSPRQSRLAASKGPARKGKEVLK